MDLPNKAPELRQLLVLFSTAFGCLGLLVACATTSQSTRLNPEEKPERYRVTCRDSSRNCRVKAREICEGEYNVISKRANRPEQKEIQNTNVSSTGSTFGQVNWKGEMIIECGRALPRLRLTRSPSGPGQPVPDPNEEVSGASATAATGTSTPPPPPLERVCIPGATQACLGPGACAGAQACVADGTGYGPCDCGEKPVRAVPSPTAPSSPAPSPNAPAPADPPTLPSPPSSTALPPTLPPPAQPLQAPSAKPRSPKAPSAQSSSSTPGQSQPE